MTNGQQNDVDSDLRRVAAYLTRSGSQYRERPATDAVAVAAMPSRSRWSGTRVSAISALLVAACAASIVVLAGGEPTERLQPMATSTATDSVSTVPLGTGGFDRSDAGDDVGPPVDDVASVDSVVSRGPIDDAPSGDDPTEPTYTAPGTRESPVITDVEVPSLVTAGTSVTFRWRAIDADSVSSTGIVVGWASGIYTPCGFGQLARLESGTAADGTWAYTCLIPANAVSTEYSVEVNAQDTFGNWSSSSGFGFTVVGGSSDADAPAYSDVTVVGSVRTGDVLTTTWTLSDASGIDNAVMWVAGPTGMFTNPDTGLRYALYETLVVTSQCSPSGDTCSFTQTVQLDPAGVPGTYALWLSATDTLGNKVLEQALSFTVVP